LDRRLPDTFGRFSRDVAVDVHDCSRAVGWNVSGIGAGIFFFSVDSDDGGGHVLRLAEIVAGQRRERAWSNAHRCPWLGVLAIGFVVSFIVAYAAVAWFLAWVRKHGFAAFAIYRIIVGSAVLAWALGYLR